jgi:hypothetical protein
MSRAISNCDIVLNKEHLICFLLMSEINLHNSFYITENTVFITEKLFIFIHIVFPIC